VVLSRYSRETARCDRLPPRSFSSSDPVAEDRAFMESLHLPFRQSVGELNERFRRAGAPLNYHNGFIQIATDGLVEAQIEKPFWALVADPAWKNVDTDMKGCVAATEIGRGDLADLSKCVSSRIALDPRRSSSYDGAGRARDQD
jgi:hypothetical protein